MTRLVLTPDTATAEEVLAAAKTLTDLGVALRLGPAVLGRFGSPAVAAASTLVPVLLDARFAGPSDEVAAGVQASAAFGATWVSIEGLVETAALAAAGAAAAPYGTLVLGTVGPTDAHDALWGGSRGKAVSRAATRMAEAGLAGLLGREQDLGVVAQVAPSLEVWVAGAADGAAASAAAARGAAAVVMDIPVSVPIDRSWVEALIEEFVHVDNIRAEETVDG